MTEEILLIIFAAVLLIFTVRGSRKGLFGFVFGALSWVFVFVFLSFASPYIETRLCETELYDSVYERVENGVRGHVNDAVEGGGDKRDGAIAGIIAMFGARSGAEYTEDELTKMINDLTGALNALNGRLDETMVEEINNVVTALSDTITARIMHILAILTSIIIAAIICQFLKMVFTVLHDLPVMGTMSRVLGAVWGFVEGLLIVWVIMLVLSLLGTEFRDFENPALIYLFDHNAILAITERMGLYHKI